MNSVRKGHSKQLALLKELGTAGSLPSENLWQCPFSTIPVVKRMSLRPKQANTHLLTSVVRNKHLLSQGLGSTSASCYHQITPEQHPDGGCSAKIVGDAQTAALNKKINSLTFHVLSA